MTSASETRIVPVEELTRFCVEALLRVGVSEEDAETVAEVLVMTDTMGVCTHGCGLLPGYIRRLEAGGLRPNGYPRIAEQGSGWAIVDGDSSLGQVTSVFAMKTAMEKAKSSGIGYVGVRNSCHFGAAGYYAWLAARENMIGLAMANDWPTVAAPGSRKAVTGSNPLAYAIPAGVHDPILLDIAIGTVAGGKVYTAQRQGTEIPDNWIIGPDGLPTTDKDLFPHSAALAPMAGHKGYGLALLIETLSALLTGSAFTWNVGNWIFGDPSLPTGHGAAFIAVDVGTVLPIESFHDRVDSLIREIHRSPKAEGCDRIYVPGEMEWERRRKALIRGVPLPADIVEKLLGLAQDLGLENHPFSK